MVIHRLYAVPAWHPVTREAADPFSLSPTHTHTHTHFSRGTAETRISFEEIYRLRFLSLVCLRAATSLTERNMFVTSAPRRDLGHKYANNLQEPTIRGFLRLPWQLIAGVAYLVQNDSLRLQTVARDYEERDISRRRDISNACNTRVRQHSWCITFRGYAPLWFPPAASPAAKHIPPGSGNPDELIERKSGGELQNAGGTCEWERWLAVR